MIIIMRPGITPDGIAGITEHLTKHGLIAHPMFGDERIVIGVIGDSRHLPEDSIERLPGIDRVVRIVTPFKLASREVCPETTEIAVKNLTIGGLAVHVIAGPCAVEDKETFLAAASSVSLAGATLLRGGAFKPRTSPYSFQGLGPAGLEILSEAGRMTGLPVVTEVIRPEDVELVARSADILQVGARNMQNFSLLRELGQQTKPVLLKRGAMASIEEWILAAEYVLSEGNPAVILCERGIRTFESATRNTLDLSAIPVVRSLTHLPIIVDPSHGTGLRECVGPMAMAAVAAGADGLMIEVHPHPETAMSDGRQSLRPQEFTALMGALRELARAVGRHIACADSAGRIPA